MLEIRSSGGFVKTEDWLERLAKGDIFKALERYGQKGVDALAAATPSRTGYTAGQWSYEVKKDFRSYSIIWSNGNVVAGRPVVILLQYGHGTGTGGYVQGQDFINPALKPIFEQIKNEVWKEVRRR